MKFSDRPEGPYGPAGFWIVQVRTEDVKDGIHALILNRYKSLENLHAAVDLQAPTGDRHARGRGYHNGRGAETVRGLGGLNLVGGDVVEVAPPSDPTGNTALVGATMMFEILCLLAGTVRIRG